MDLDAETKERKPRGPLLRSIAAVAVLGLLGLAYVLGIGRGKATETAQPGPSPTVSPTTPHPIGRLNPNFPHASLPIIPVLPTVSADAPFVGTPPFVLGRAVGERLTLTVLPLAYHDEHCVTHAFRVGKLSLGAYRSDCSDWHGFDLYFYYVRLENTSDKAVTINLRHFVIVTIDQQAYGPVDVRSDARFPQAFLPETSLIPARASLVGWLTFDARIDFVPARLSYVDNSQTLTLTFEGKHVVFSRG